MNANMTIGWSWVASSPLRGPKRRRPHSFRSPKLPEALRSLAGPEAHRPYLLILTGSAFLEAGR
jgi:hypothetical protein